MGRNKQATCKICYKEMRSNNLVRHMKVHQPRVQTLEKSVQTDSNPCNDCNFEAARKDKSWLCDVCAYQTDRKDKLKRHIKSIHQNIKFECNFLIIQACLDHYKNNRKDSLRRHHKLKHGEPCDASSLKVYLRSIDLEGTV